MYTISAYMLCRVYMFRFSGTIDRPTRLVAMTPVFSLCYYLLYRCNNRNNPPSTKVTIVLITLVMFATWDDYTSTRVSSLPRTPYMFTVLADINYTKASSKPRTPDMRAPAVSRNSQKKSLINSSTPKTLAVHPDGNKHWVNSG